VITRQQKAEAKNTFLPPFDLEIPARTGIKKYTKYGTMSVKNLGPNEWPAHQSQ
jgi:hypothetical protein